MKKYLLLFAALSLASAATARNPRKTSRAADFVTVEARDVAATEDGQPDVKVEIISMTIE